MTINDEITKARERGVGIRRERGYVVHAQFLTDSRELLLSFDNGTKFSIPIGLLEGMQHACDEDIAEIEITPSGLGLRWETLDLDFGVHALTECCFGSKKYMSQLG